MKNEINFTQKQIELIKSQIVPGASKGEIDLLIYQAQRTGLDPLTRQIYAIFRSGKMTIQTSIDGFRVIAERSGSYAGQSEPIFIEEEGKLVACKISVYRFRGDVRYEASVGLAYWDEYCQKFNGKASGMWAKMPRTMLAKVAEALALRKAYPQDLSGIYTSEEMAQADYNNNVNESRITMKDLANIADDELKSGRAERKRMKEEEDRRRSEDRFKKIKIEIEGCGSAEEIEAVFERENKTISYFENSQPDLFDMLTECMNDLIESMKE